MTSPEAAGGECLMGVEICRMPTVSRSHALNGGSREENRSLIGQEPSLATPNWLPVSRHSGLALPSEESSIEGVQDAANYASLSSANFLGSTPDVCASIRGH